MRVCCVLSSDAAFFHQAAASIDTMRQALLRLPQHAVEIAFVAINLPAEHLDWLHRNGVRVHSDLGDFPRFPGAPDHTYALTCRPYIPWILPEYDGYVWVDSDIRFLSHEGLVPYLEGLAAPEISVVAVQETEAAYAVHTEPRLAQVYHSARNRRLSQVYGDEVMQYCQYFTPFNGGLFAATADSPIWARYRRNLDKALKVPFDAMLEQDALNVSIQEVGDWRRLPTVMNWLCSLRMPEKAADGTWRHPDEPFRQVLVAHLTNSSAPVMLPDGPGTYYDQYRSAGLTV
ncbi:MAG TPA: hypothetical protein VGG99_14750 [Acetobacteraceae bacterium]|jgi:hypothetical protein